MKVVLIVATTADGKIAKDASHGADWTSKEDKKFFVEKTKEAGVLIMGSSTYETIGRPLPNRLNIVMTRNPDKYQDQPEVLEFVNQEPKEILDGLEKRGYEEVVLAGGATINSLFLAQGLVDEIYLTIEPLVFGKGISIFSEPIEGVSLEMLEQKKISDNVILIHYKVKK